MAKLILQQADLFLQAQLQAALASDQRATAMANILVAASAASLAASAALVDKIERAGLAGIVAAALVFLVAAGFAAWAARPLDHWLPGSRPEQWLEGRHEALNSMIGGAAENCQVAIDANEEFMGANQRSLRIALALSLIAPLAGTVTWWLA